LAHPVTVTSPQSFSVRTGLIPAEFGERFRQATQLHQDSDVGSQAPPDRLKELLASAESFVTTTKLFLGKP
jgi:hypothetical protein